MKKRINHRGALALAQGIAALALLGGSQALLADGDPAIVIEDESALQIEAGDDALVIEEPSDEAGDTLLIEDAPAGDAGPGGDGLMIEDSTLADEPPAMPPATPDMAEPANDGVRLTLDDVWLEYAAFDGASNADGQGYAHLQATLNWQAAPQWELQLSGRADGYTQDGLNDFSRAKLDYDESFVRFSNSQLRLTLGAQKVLWGRIDEFAPTDRVSSVDLSRYVLDDLADRRRAAPVVRLETFLDNGKLDLVYLPQFREAELADPRSIWYPVRRATGQILGVEATPALAAVVMATPIDDDGPDDNGGAGARFSSRAGDVDYALTVQKVRHSTPYFTLNPVRGVIEARHPRTWVLGGDLGVEAMDAIWRFEAAWLSETPATTTNGSYLQAESINWAGGVEFFPGDGDARVNLQLMGRNLLNAPKVLDRNEIYLLNGTFETPFAQNRWLFRLRFNYGLDEQDIYLNPKLAYTGIDAHEFYLQGHYFTGDAGTPGDYFEDDSLIQLGWRAQF